MEAGGRDDPSLRVAALGQAPFTRADFKAMMRRLDNIPSAANQALAAVSAVFTWAVREEILPTNPCKQVQSNPTRSRERILSATEIPAVWSAFNGAGPLSARR